MSYYSLLRYCLFELLSNGSDIKARPVTDAAGVI